MSSTWNGTIWEVEKKLSDHFLRSDGEFGASPLSFLDASDEELAKALGHDQPHMARIEFLHSFSATHVRDVFATGNILKPPQDIDAPGWFRFLVLSCVIAATSTETSDVGDFRRRLAEQLETELTFTDLHGVAILWQELSRWCERRKKRGDPFRIVRLPDPGTWTHIGHTLKIAFPSRRDLDRISRYFSDERPDFSNPRTVLRSVRDSLHVAHWSDAFKAAFRDFESRTLNGERMLSEHPFLVAMRKGCSVASIVSSTMRCELVVTTDIDGQNVATFTFPDLRTAHSAGSEDITATMDIPKLMDVIRASSEAMAGDELLSSFDEGAIPLVETGWGLWKFVRAPEAGRIRLLTRRDIAERYLSATGISADWILTSPQPLDRSLNLLRNIRPDFAKSEQNLLPRPSVIGGIRVGTNHLGVPCTLPAIKAGGNCEVAIRSVDHVEGELSIAAPRGGEFSLTAPSRLDGIWIAAVSEYGSPVLDLGLKFAPYALQHESEAYVIDESKWQREREIASCARFSLEAVSGGPQPEQFEPADFPDIFEAIYAGGAHGWDEARLVPLLSRWFDQRQIGVWEALHVLADSGWLEPRLSTGWRARRWFLRPPRVVTLGNGLFYLDGAHCHIIRAQFRTAAEKASADVFSVKLPGAWSVPALFCRKSNLAGAVPDFGLPIHDPVLQIPSLHEACNLEETRSSDRSRTARSTWSWAKRRFVSMPASLNGKITVERLQHNGDRAPDIYVVKGPEVATKLFESRAIAILFAHKLAGVPMFDWDPKAQILTRTTQEGWLPRDLAECVRLGSGVGPAIALTDSGNVYKYFVDPRLAQHLRAWLGPTVSSSLESNGAMEAVLRRRLGTIGQLVAARSTVRGRYAP